MIQGQELRTAVALYKKRELQRNCLVTLVQTTLLTLIVGYGLGIKNIGPFRNVALLEKYQIGMISSGIVVSTMIGVRIAVKIFFDKEVSEAELFLMLERLNQGKIWENFPEGKKWFAIGNDGITNVTILENNESQSSFQSCFNEWYQLNKEKKSGADLRLQRGMVTPIYSITLASLIVLGIGLVVKYREGFLSFTENQARPLILSGAIITALGVSILGIEKIIRKKNRVTFLSKDTFIAVCKELPKKPLTSAQIIKQCDALIEKLLRGALNDAEFDQLKTLLRSSAISDHKKVEIFFSIELRKNALNTEHILTLQRFIFTETGPWKNVSKEMCEHSRTCFSTQTLPPVQWKEFCLKFEPNLPLDQFDA